MLNYALLTKAINKLDEKKMPQAKPKVDAAAFIEDVNSKYNTVDKYFSVQAPSLLDSGEAMLNSADLASLDYPLTIGEMLEKM